MGLPDPDDVAAYDKLMGEVPIGGPEVLPGPIVVQDYDPAWPGRFEREAARIAGALGDRVVRLEHVGSTSVPGLPAKSIIDIALEVPDSAAESAYVPDLEAAGYVLRVREPEWFEHRLLRAPDRTVHVHVFSAGCTETDRMVRFRDRLRDDASDRDRYARAKRELAARDWKYMQQYADAKTDIVADIMSRAGDDSSTVKRARFELQFPVAEIEALAARFPSLDDTRLEAVGAAARARGHYTRAEFIEVCGWKTPRSRPRVAANPEPAVTAATERALGASDEAERMAALLELGGVGVPTASTLLYVAFPQDYPILDVRALESLGVKARSTYPLSFWLAYLEACRTIARQAGVSLRTLDKALWQRSKELSETIRAGDPVDQRSA
jgi:GrpB-like predicted nucleotidyltransferase (UPF0157 family)